MKIRIYFLCLLPLFCSSFFSEAQENKGKGLHFDGVIQSRYEYLFSTNESRFNVRNTALGLTGKLNSALSYRTQVGLSRDGRFCVLTLSASYALSNRLNVTLGQTFSPLHSLKTISPNFLLFSNAPFIGDGYFGSSRDIGVVVKYDILQGDLPLGFDLGVFNGGGINNPTWFNTPATAATLRLGKMYGFSSSLKMMYNPNVLNPGSIDGEAKTSPNLYFGGDIRYWVERWQFDLELMHKKEMPTNNSLFSYYIQGGYYIENLPLLTAQSKLRYLLPTLRFDAIGSEFASRGFEVNRLTLGLGFGLRLGGSSRFDDSLLRINYELFMPKNNHVIGIPGIDIKNKLLVELLIRF